MFGRFGSRFLIAVVVVALSAAACTADAPAPPPTAGATTPPSVQSPSPEPSPSPTPLPEGLVLHVVADLRPGSDDQSYLEGMRLAEQRVSAEDGVGGLPLRLAFHDHQGKVRAASRRLRSLAERGAVAALYVGPGTAVARIRPVLVETSTPVILLEGDLYTARRLFSPVFQTTIPWSWEAHALARYLVRDRKAERIGLLAPDPAPPGTVTAARAALAYWGGRLDQAVTVVTPDGPEAGPRIAGLAGSVDAVFVHGPPAWVFAAAQVLRKLGQLGRSPRIAASSGLLAAPPALLQPGTAVPYVHTWAGWAEPIPRVRKFRRAFSSMGGRLPSGMEQEGHDAVRVMAWALGRTGGEGGRRLVNALESAEGLTFSGFPLDFGPDDHLFGPRDELGVYAVPGRRERLDPWQSRDGVTWRPIMRTFTYDGRKSSILERDRRIFFPFWRKNRPSPPYWRSAFGITTRPRDPLH